MTHRSRNTSSIVRMALAHQNAREALIDPGAKAPAVSRHLESRCVVAPTSQ